METGDCGEVWDPERGWCSEETQRHMGWVFGGILEMVGGVSRTWSPIE
jgi:hypothetical protein